LTADNGRVFYDYNPLAHRPYTDNFMYAFQTGQGLSGAEQNVPLGATLVAGDFKLDHNVGALFNASGTANVNFSAFVPSSVATVANPSHLVDDVAKSQTIAKLIDSTIQSHAQEIRTWFAGHPSSPSGTFSSEDGSIV
jgi:hypothetical protein